MLQLRQSAHLLPCQNWELLIHSLTWMTNLRRKVVLDHEWKHRVIAVHQGHHLPFQQCLPVARFNSPNRPPSPRPNQNPQTSRRLPAKHLCSTTSISLKRLFGQAPRKALMIRFKLKFPHSLNQSQHASASPPSLISLPSHRLIPYALLRSVGPLLHHSAPILP